MFKNLSVQKSVLRKFWTFSLRCCYINIYYLVLLIQFEYYVLTQKVGEFIFIVEIKNTQKINLCCTSYRPTNSLFVNVCVSSFGLLI